MRPETVVFALDRTQFEAWQAACGRPAGDAVVVTGDMEVAAELEAGGRAYREVWSYLEAADVDRAQRQCRELAAEWWRPFLGGLKHHGVELADALSGDMWLAFTD